MNSATVAQKGKGQRRTRVMLLRTTCTMHVSLTVASVHGPVKMRPL
jgi:hypothetical protein